MHIKTPFVYEIKNNHIIASALNMIRNNNIIASALDMIRSVGIKDHDLII